jgi:hypothetical protein
VTVNIDLGAADLNLLHSALQRHLLVLREELVRTDDRQYRQNLRDDVNRLEALFRRLEELRPSEPDAGGPVRS